MHGPLYHLTKEEDRIKALSEAKRVLRPNGVVLAFTITRYAGINYGITEGLIFERTYYEVMKEEVLTGICNKAFFAVVLFTT